jgi:hypothetical protein
MEDKGNTIFIKEMTKGGHFKLNTKKQDKKLMKYST